MLRKMGRLIPPLLTVLLVLAPCVPASAQTVSLNLGGRAMRITAGDAAALPADFPADVALPDGHAVVQVQHAGEEITVETDAPGDVDTVLARLRERMRAAGWNAAKVARPADGQAQAWEKERRAVVAWVKPAVDGGVRVQLQLLPKR